MKLMFNESLEIRWKIAHFCILNFSRPIISFCLRSNIKHSTQCFITRWNTSKFVKNTPLRVVFSTLFSVFHLVMKHYVSCLIYYFTNNAPSKHFFIWSTNYQYVCRVLCVENVCNENSDKWQRTECPSKTTCLQSKWFFKAVTLRSDC